MKRGYYRSNSRQKSYDRHKTRRSTSRSRDKYNKKQNSFRTSLAKVESDIKNHFRFKLPNLNTKQEQDTISMLKSKLNEHIGPVEHITRSRQTMTLNLGFKYDIDALSFLQTGGLTVKTSSHKIHLDPVPTKAFENIIKQRRQQSIGQKRDKVGEKSNQNRTNHRRKKSQSKSQSRSYSSSSSSRKKNYRSKSKEKQCRIFFDSAIKLQIYGIPAYLNQEKIVSLINHFQGGAYKVLRQNWKLIKDTSCEYLQIRLDAQKAERLIQNGNKLQIDGRPVLLIEDTERPVKQFINYQIQINFPKAVQPGKVFKYLYQYAKIVQLVANQQIQQDGKSKSYIITFNEKGIVATLKKIGELSCGIRVVEPKQGILVFRPSQLLPTRLQL